MKNLVEKLNQDFEAFAKDASLQIEKGNKAAGTRARKVSLAIEKQLKDFRKKSIENSK
jgi:Histone H1-like protein Hc1.